MELKAGSIFVVKKFEFEDGFVKPKFLVQLNNPRKNEPVLFCLTTSQVKRYRKKYPIGCQRKSKYFFIKKCNYFEKDTWLELDRIFDYDFGKILNNCYNGNLIYKNKIDDDCLIEIKDCIKESKDIDEQLLKMIVETIIK